MLPHLIAELAAATPPPAPAAAPATAIVVRVGQGGEWFGPSLVLAASLLLDWTAVGPVALRDRVAAAGYYSAAVAMISIFAWDDDIQGWFGGSWSWQLTGSAIAAVMHCGLLVAAIGHRWKWTAGMAKRLGKLIHLEHGDSTANRINSVLMGWAVTAGASSVLARGPMASFVHFVARALTGFWSWLGNVLVTALGG
jgi:hypothetical protein